MHTHIDTESRIPLMLLRLYIFQVVSLPPVLLLTAITVYMR